MGHRPHSTLWYLLLIVFPAFGVLLVVQQSVVVSSLILVLVLTAIDIGSRRDIRWDQSLACYLFVAAVTACLFQYLSFGWMYPPVPAGADQMDLALLDEMHVLDLQMQTGLMTSAALFFVASQPHRHLPRLLGSSAVFALAIYPVFGGWAWGTEENNFRDFAGGCVVYGVASWSAVGVWLAHRWRSSGDVGERP